MASLATQTAYEEAMILEIEEPIISAAEEPIISATMDPTHEQIAALAYSYWQESGCRDGADKENWLRAEQELITNQ
ncbi:MAG: DUF2934 domain-containing protein [Bryobacteraceae bacterium]